METGKTVTNVFESRCEGARIEELDGTPDSVGEPNLNPVTKPLMTFAGSTLAVIGLTRIAASMLQLPLLDWLFGSSEEPITTESARQSARAFRAAREAGDAARDAARTAREARRATPESARAFRAARKAGDGARTARGKRQP